MTLGSRYLPVFQNSAAGLQYVIEYGPGTVLRAQHTHYLIPISQPPKASIVVHSLPRRKQHCKIKQLVQGPTNSKWRGGNLNPPFCL